MVERVEEVVWRLVQKAGQSGDGVDLLDLLSDIDHICQDSVQQGSTQCQDAGSAPITQSRNSAESVWRQLTRIPNLSIGLGRQLNHLTLAEISVHNNANHIRVYADAGDGSQVQRQPSEEATSGPLSSTFHEELPEILARQRNGEPTRPYDSSPSASSAVTHALDNQDISRRTSSRRSTRSASVTDVNPTSAKPSKAPKTTKAPLATEARQRQQPNDQRRVGGTRKYLRGLEGFWNEHFWHARNQYEGFITPRFNAGIATHPAARALYSTRPHGIDDVILRAIEAGLPVPSQPQYLTRAWMIQTSWVLDRAQEGVYLTPPGIRRVDASQYSNHSDTALCQMLIVKSDRLRQVNTSEHEQCTSVLFNTTSVAHTRRRQGFFSVRPTSSTGQFGPQVPPLNAEENYTYMISPPPKIGPTRGPPLGVFHHGQTSPMDTLASPSLTRDSSGTPIRQQRRRRHSMAADCTSDVGSQSRATTVSLKSPPFQPTVDEGLQTAASWQGLPPPLTTRSRKRKLSGNIPSASSPIKRRKPHVVTKVASAQSLLSPTTITMAEATPSRTSDAVELDLGDPRVSVPASSSPKGQLIGGKSSSSKKSRENTKDIIKHILLEVMEECGGMVPSELSSISDYVNEKWRRTGKSGQADKKKCKESIKNLCASGKMKKLTFTFRRKTGSLVSGSILTTAEIDATSEAVMRLQQNIINALPDIYVPPSGSVLYASSIESRPSEAPSDAVQARKGSSSTLLPRSQTVRRSRTRYGSRKDNFAASPARNPFIWYGPLDHTPMQGSEDSLVLAYLFLAAYQSGTGDPIWTNAELGKLEEERVPAKRKTKSVKPGSKLKERQRPSADALDLADTQAQVRVPKKRSSRRTAPPTQDHIHDAEQDLGITTSNPIPKFGRSSRGRKIIWKNRENDVLPPALPSSLYDILEMPGQIPAIDYSMTEDPGTNFFSWELDAVEYWETQILKIYQQQASDWTFINHISKNRPFPGPPDYSELQWEQPEILKDAKFTSRPTSIKRKRPVAATKSLGLEIEQTGEESADSAYTPELEDQAEAPPRKRQRRISLQPVQRAKERPKRKYIRKRVHESGAPWKRQGRPRMLKDMSSEEIYRIVISVLVVRTLAGGINSDIDWSIVQRLCPGRDQDFVMSRWETLLVKNRQDIGKLNMNLQDNYISAYEKGEVPGINFDSLDDSDWEGIVLWAEHNLTQNASGDVAALPSMREEFFRTYVCNFDEPQTLRDALAYTGQPSNSLKAEIMASTPAAVPLQISATDTFGFRAEAEVEEEDRNLSRAKSWAVSTVLTHDEALDTAKVTRKLWSITPNKREAEELFDRALKVLQRNLVIKRERGLKAGGVLQAGWRSSERWIEMFDTKRMITAKMLKEAAAWKRDVLDCAFTTGDGVEIPKTLIMQDGHMVAIVNMVANGRCKITAGRAGLPRGRYGLDTDATSYKTNGMSRVQTLFATTVRPVPGIYVPGDPMASARLEAPTWQDGGRGNIPCWIDINGNLLKEIWEMVVSAVAGLLSGRPGLQAVEIERSLGHGLPGWEVEIVLSWLSSSGFVQRTQHGSGWEAKEWWWMVCGYGS